MLEEIRDSEYPDRTNGYPQVSLLIYDVMMTISSHYGFGRDMEDIIAIKGEVDGMEAITRAILYSAIGQTVLVVGTVLSKTSLALFLVRLVSTRRDKVAIWVPDFFLGTAVVASLFVFWFSCQPTAYLWDRRLDGECTIDPGPISMYAGSWSVILDFWYAAFPWWMLWKIQMPRRDKVIIASSMSLGVFAGACGIKRAIELQNLGSPNYLSKVSSLHPYLHDLTQAAEDVVGIIIWHAAEICTTMVCIGIPVCRPLYKDWVARFISTENNTDSGGGWMGGKSNSQSSAGVFGLHTIGGSDYQNITNGNTAGTARGKPGGDSTDEDVSFRNDVDTKARQEVTVQAGYPAVLGRSAADNTSEESILGEDSRAAEGQQGKPSIVVLKEFRVGDS